ncbi:MULTISPECIES: hypothetical protein [unclassified Cupriavidus]|uniref:hypothetical protein n=1 Tax=unclassified Cupriavidus TaxID=2640874 RepID=UPI001C007A3B|nr:MULTISPECIES: hypothetical protein [unclassified Cupriavidus]MCA3182404.1 hypothetical protein [Cupriavidus sp.]MCA3189044.1 hypothetical protein [Cupriavidus sp.]MCA3198763.1 hypothetical protein [Cupriavidus sp.]MCA3201509.1 hypothetical protein [Cupriavidus sp.]MCA3209935.1 hypothetical protein [Cupriavidus sp.]
MSAHAVATLLALYLTAWWCCIGVVMGGLVIVWIHNLTGGAWGEPLRAPLLGMARYTWLLALLFLPILAGVGALYPWAADAARGAQRWVPEIPAHSAAFKSFWLSRPGFVVRGVAVLAIWAVLAALSPSARRARSPRFAAAALIVYGLTVSIAAVDWIMSLMPLWYSSVFGLLLATGQAGAALALGTWLAARRGTPPDVLIDLGNLLMTAVITWAYLAFTQYLIIWAEDLPHEIGWYLARRVGVWPILAWVLALGHFALPMLALLSRRVKRSPPMLATVAGTVLVMHAVEACWLVLPSTGGHP